MQQIAEIGKILLPDGTGLRQAMGVCRRKPETRGGPLSPLAAGFPVELVACKQLFLDRRGNFPLAAEWPAGREPDQEKGDRDDAKQNAKKRQRAAKDEGGQKAG